MDLLRLRLVALAAYTKGGLGDVTALPENEFEQYYNAMLVHSDLLRDQMDAEMKKAREQEE